MAEQIWGSKREYDFSELAGQSDPERLFVWYRPGGDRQPNISRGGLEWPWRDGDTLPMAGPIVLAGSTPERAVEIASMIECAFQPAQLDWALVTDVHAMIKDIYGAEIDPTSLVRVDPDPDELVAWKVICNACIRPDRRWQMWLTTIFKAGHPPKSPDVLSYLLQRARIADLPEEIARDWRCAAERMAWLAGQWRKHGGAITEVAQPLPSEYQETMRRYREAAERGEPMPS